MSTGSTGSQMMLLYVLNVDSDHPGTSAVAAEDEDEFLSFVTETLKPLGGGEGADAECGAGSAALLRKRRDEDRAAAVATACRQFGSFVVNSSKVDGKPDLATIKRTSANMYIDSFDVMEYWTVDADRVNRHNLVAPLFVKSLMAQLASTETERVRL